MKAVVMSAPGDVRVIDCEEPTLELPTDAIVELSAACICGSDLWPYRGIEPLSHPQQRMGHEYVGVVKEVGAGVKHLNIGDFVVGSFVASCNECEICVAGYQSRCIKHVGMGDIGTQAERIRVPLADGTLVKTSGSPGPALLADLLAASDVLGTGWFAAQSAGAGPGKTIAVIGDGAVGLCAVLAARHFGAERIIVSSRNPARRALAQEFGATHLTDLRGQDFVNYVKELTDGYGAHGSAEAVGTEESMWQAIHATRPGGKVGYVGVLHGVKIDGLDLFFQEVSLLGGPAPVRRYLPELIDLIEKRVINPGLVFDLALPFEQAADGYAAMDARRAIKVMLTF